MAAKSARAQASHTEGRGFGWLVGRLLEHNVLATSKVIYQDGYQLVTVCTNSDFIVLPLLKNQIAGTMTRYPTQSYYPDNRITSPCTIILMSNARLGSDKNQF